MKTNQQNLVRAATLALGVMLFPLASAWADAGHGKKAEIGAPGAESEVSKTITVVLQDAYFEPEIIDVRPGETVKFVLENKGELLHEFNIGTPAMHERHQKEMMLMMEHGMLTATSMNHDMPDMDHGDMPADMPMKHDDPNSVLLEPGETKELIWTFTHTGGIEFACNIPGHYESGMVGQFTINVSMN